MFLVSWSADVSSDGDMKDCLWLYSYRHTMTTVVLNEVDIFTTLHSYISFVPTSAHSGDGMGNLVGLLVQLSENFLAQRLAFAEDLQVRPGTKQKEKEKKKAERA